MKKNYQPGRYKQKALLICSIGLFLSLIIGPLTGEKLVESSAPGVSTAAKPDLKTADNHLDKTPPREMTGLQVTRNGWKYQCMDCHRFLDARWHYDRPMQEHQNVQLKHGVNRFCLNCHHPENRNVFVDYDGSEIAAKEVVRLCGKCHGPTYRDWAAGAHGRQSGFMDDKKGDQNRLLCIQCHNPHAPAFGSMKPLAPPTYPARAAGHQ